MESFSTLQLLCACTVQQSESVRAAGMLPAYLCYRIEDGPTLYRSAPPQQIQGGVLMAQSQPLTQLSGGEQLCRQAVRECRARGALGFAANWSQPPTEQLCRLTTRLDDALSKAKLEFWVGERCAKCIKHGNILISSAISGGTLRLRLSEAMERYGTNRVTLAVERMAEDFTLPARNGCGEALSQEQLQDLLRRLSPTVYFSSELCAHYFTYLRQGQTHFVLFDTKNSILRKLRLAEELGGRFGMVAWEEFENAQC